MIKSLRLNNFRGFGDLVLRDFGAVNLIVGRNNAGKTSFLESIAMFGGGQNLNQIAGAFRTTAQNSQQAFFRWLLRDGANQGEIRADRETGTSILHFEKSPVAENLNHQFLHQGMMPISQQQTVAIYQPSDQRSATVSVISVQPKTSDEIVRLFGAAVDKKGGEERMDELFHEMDSRISKVRISAVDGLQIRFDIGLSEMVPMPQMGQGVQHLIRIFSQLIAEGSDACLIDEIENGIHHSMLEQVWSGIATASVGLGTQVFATTHSYECVEAAHAAFSKRESYDLRIIQLFRVAEGVQGRVLDRKHIEAALDGQIDLR